MKLPNRKTIGILAIVVLLSIGGFSVFGAQTAGASVNINELQINDGEFEAESIDPVIEIEGQYEYEVDQMPDEMVFILLVDGSVVAQETLPAEGLDDTGSFEIAGDVTDGPYSSSDFVVEDGETVSNDIDVTLAFQLRDSDGTFISATANDEVTITVVSPVTGNPYATIGGIGEIIDNS